MKNKYYIEKELQKFKNKGYTSFVSEQEQIILKKILPKEHYLTFPTYEGVGKVIFYQTGSLPLSYLAVPDKSFRHQDVLGALFNLGLKNEMFSDIILYENKWCFSVFSCHQKYIEQNLIQIRNQNIKVIEIEKEYFYQFKQQFKKYNIIISSLRIDNVISTLIPCSRKDALVRIKNKEIFLNYEELKRPTKTLVENDIFSIYHVGKFIFKRIIQSTKKGGFLVEIWKYQ